MTPFKIKVSIDHYEQMGYELKTGDTIYLKDKYGDYSIHGELIKFEEKIGCWLAKNASYKSFPMSKVSHYIEILVVPFAQYMKKMKEKSIY